jgi:putative transposase
VVKPGQRREAVTLLCKKYCVSERKACRVMDQPRGTQRYVCKVRDDEEIVVKKMVRLLKKHPRAGVKMMTAMLRRGGVLINHKRVARLMKKHNLQHAKVRKRRRKALILGRKSNSCQARPSLGVNDVWSWDFTESRTSDGRKIRWLTLIDEYSRECLAMLPSRSWRSADVVRVLARAIGHYGKPEKIRCDNGTEFTAEVVQDYLRVQVIEALFIAPSSPWENGFEESFHGRMKAEFLNQEKFESLAEAKLRGQRWRQQYNTKRLHSSLSYCTPREKRVSFFGGLAGTPDKRNPTSPQKNFVKT